MKINDIIIENQELLTLDQQWADAQAKACSRTGRHDHCVFYRNNINKERVKMRLGREPEEDFLQAVAAVRAGDVDHTKATDRDQNKGNSPEKPLDKDRSNKYQRQKRKKSGKPERKNDSDSVVDTSKTYFDKPYAQKLKKKYQDMLDRSPTVRGYRTGKAASDAVDKFFSKY